MLSSWDRIAELRIRIAEKRGELDDLPYQNQHLPDYDLAGLSHDERIEALAARSCGGVPEEVLLLKRIEELEQALAEAGDDARRDELGAELYRAGFRLHILARRGRRPLLAARAEKYLR